MQIKDQLLNQAMSTWRTAGHMVNGQVFSEQWPAGVRVCQANKLNDLGIVSFDKISPEILVKL